MTKAPAPIIGGISCPPVDAAASMPAAKRGLKPERIIIGIVIIPVDAVVATAEPETEPINPELMIAMWPAPPGYFPAVFLARVIMKSPAPDFSKKHPNKTNIKTKVAEIFATMPNIPSPPQKLLYKTVSKLKPGNVKIPGTYFPKNNM